MSISTYLWCPVPVWQSYSPPSTQSSIASVAKPEENIRFHKAAAAALKVETGPELSFCAASYSIPTWWPVHPGLEAGNCPPSGSPTVQSTNQLSPLIVKMNSPLELARTAIAYLNTWSAGSPTSRSSFMNCQSHRCLEHLGCRDTADGELQWKVFSDMRWLFWTTCKSVSWGHLHNSCLGTAKMHVELQN